MRAKYRVSSNIQAYPAISRQIPPPETRKFNFLRLCVKAHQLTQRERITLGLLAQHEALTSRELSGYPNGHRHLIGGAYVVYTVYDLGEDISQLLLSTPPYIESKFNHELATRQSFITNKGIMEAAFRLYFDPSLKKPKRGAQLKKKAPGTLYRFIDVIQQLDLNYDLYSMTGNEIISILPAEFDKWKE